ncbi:unnamed protein product [Lymnaea stagnalis]|uniref:Calpain catalytic domain-containing protein n=1 Tax=Lymnaea stagnalis TaxID=6523 RepID=A0AAV2HAK4_LYMST
MQSYYIDETFPRSPRSWVGRDAFVCDRIVWKRPSAMVRQPEFVVDGAKRHDLDQGALGNCWFISAAAALATHHPDRFKKVVPLGQTFNSPQYTGMFVFNFCSKGIWKQVYIDDFIPTDASEMEPKYCRNTERSNEFWPCLLEKAYAKLHGSYEALNGGHIVDALVELTGGLPEKINLRGHTRGSPQLFEKLSSCYQMRAVMGAAIYSGDQNRNRLLNGLISGHAYSITGLHSMQAGGRDVSLVRLRNPWGRGEWKGAWSDRSKEMNALPKVVQQTLRFHIKDDGEFWMEFNDFITMFDEIHICHL